jgi:hypothetical protein
MEKFATLAALAALAALATDVAERHVLQQQ